MPACSPGHLRPISNNAPAFRPQRIENTGPKSLRAGWKAIAGGAGLRERRAPEAASFAGRNIATAWRRRYLDWMKSSLKPTSTDLFTRLPFTDAVALAVLVGTGRVTWPELDAALDAMIKLAAEAFGVPSSGETGNRTVEDEIWARYHAQCDAVFAGSIGPADTYPSERLWHTEHILDRLRSARDRELAAARRRLHARSCATAASEIWLSPTGRAALDKLDATGFIASAGMIAAIGDLVGEIDGTLGSGA